MRRRLEDYIQVVKNIITLILRSNEKSVFKWTRETCAISTQQKMSSHPTKKLLWVRNSDPNYLHKNILYFLNNYVHIFLHCTMPTPRVNIFMRSIGIDYVKVDNRKSWSENLAIHSVMNQLPFRSANQLLLLFESATTKALLWQLIYVVVVTAHWYT